MTNEQTTVSFHQMKDGTAKDYQLLDQYEDQYAAELPDRILARLEQLKFGISGYQVTRFEHSLQTATRAMRDGADADWLAAALLHDIGDDLAPSNHDTLAASVIAPYVREECTWAVRHHGIFQFAYYGDKVGKDPEARQKFANHPYYAATVTFCERWDQASFDPNYDNAPLSAFEPIVREVFLRKPWDDTHLRPGQCVPLVNEHS